MIYNKTLVYFVTVDGGGVKTYIKIDSANGGAGMTGTMKSMASTQTDMDGGAGGAAQVSYMDNSHARTGPESARCWQHRADSGPVLVGRGICNKPFQYNDAILTDTEITYIKTPSYQYIDKLHPMNYAYIFLLWFWWPYHYFIGLLSFHLPILFRVDSLALGQSYDCLLPMIWSWKVWVNSVVIYMQQ